MLNAARTTKSLLNKVCIVTGGGSGIGRAISARFAEEGAIVVCPDINADTAKATAKAITDAGLIAYTPDDGVDVSKESHIEHLFKDVTQKFGGVDVLVANAGIQIVKPTEEFTYEEWRRVTSINLDGCFLTTKYALREMYQNEARGRAAGGSIVYIASVHSKTASLLKAPYCSAKHGVLGLARVVAKEGAKHNVRTNVVNPGFVLTPLVEKQIPQQAATLKLSEEEVVQKIMLKDTVDGKFTTLDEVNDVVVFLASRDSCVLTGQSLNVSHGWVME